MAQPRQPIGSQGLTAAQLTKEPQRDELSVQCEGVSKKYSHFTLENINLELPTGSVMSFIGTNGRRQVHNWFIEHQQAGSQAPALAATLLSRADCEIDL
jgi:hypothetical protein